LDALKMIPPFASTEAHLNTYGKTREMTHPPSHPIISSSDEYRCRQIQYRRSSSSGSSKGVSGFLVSTAGWGITEVERERDASTAGVMAFLLREVLLVAGGGVDVSTSFEARTLAEGLD
jgi:hypothetical protein